ncbi:HET-domain-containing protein, partial [Sporormia fimetaria CBS 119925]
YRYQSLGDPESKRIRVFSLLPDGSIRIQPISLNATDTPRYEALSYCWGNPNELWALRCFEGDSQEEQILYVPQNLLYALSALLRDGFDTLLWADSICINQADTSEKSWQVSMMTDIYKNASRVIVFLG